MIGKIKDIRLLLLAALPAFMLASCSQEEMDGGQGTQSGEIRFEIGFAPQSDAMQTNAHTRVATDTEFRSTWEKGDEIGVFAVEHGKDLAASDNLIHNVKLTYTDGEWKAEEDIYWPKDGTKLDFYAYHPYIDVDNLNPTLYKFSVYADQSESTDAKSNYNLSDLLTAKTTKADGYGKGETVPLSFTHALAMVQVNVSKSMVGDYAPDVLNVWLNGCTTDGVLNLSTRTVTRPLNPASPEKIKMYPCPNDGGVPGTYAYRALVPAQEIAQGTALFSFEYGGNTLLRSEPLAEPLSLVAGTAETFDMTFPFTSATVSLSVRLINLFTSEELAAITRLKVMGEMTAADFTTIRDKMPAIASLDLGAATVEGDAIPRNAFLEKTSLKDFVFPRKIKTIGYSAFNLCSGLTGSLTIPEGVTTIGYSAFNLCSGLTGSLTIPEGVTTISDYAFNLCSGLTGSLTIPEGVTTIGNKAFNGCSGLTGSLTIPEGVTTISDYAFNRCSGFTGSLTIPQGVTTIGNYAFNGCSGFTGSLNIPQGVTTIGNYAFDGCSGFTGPLNIPAGVQTIAGNAFNACRGITSLTIPASITSIGIAAFGYCTELTEITSLILEPEKVEYNVRIFYGTTADKITLYVPAGKVASYQKLELWNSFKTIKELPAKKTKNN